jgi:hypothetical protein
MDIPVITIVVLAILAVVFIVAMIKAFSAAHWLHLTLIFLTFVASITGAIVLSRSYKMRAAWQQRVAENQRIYEEQKEAYKVVRDGPRDSTSADLSSVTGSMAKLKLETFGQGRVWPNGTVQADGENFIVTLATGGGDGSLLVNDNPAAQLQPRMLVYVYRDGPIPESAYQDPDAEDTANLTAPSSQASGASTFLGVMQVIAAQTNQVTLKPINTLNTVARRLGRDAQGQIVLQDGKPVVESVPVFPEIAAEFATPSSTWTLYEKVPVDSRDAFKRLKSQILSVDPRADTTDFDAYQAAYRQELTQFMPPESFGWSLDNPAQKQMYEAIIDRYAFDQMRLTDINKWINDHKDDRANTAFEPPAEERFVLLKFNAPSQEYEVDTNTGNVRDSGAFDSLGRAVLNMLWATPDGTGKIRLDKDEIVVVDPESAVKLKEAEQVEDLGEVFVRRLNDFPALTSNYNLERERIFDGLLRLIDEIESLKVTDADTQAQERQRTQWTDQLNQDLANLQADAQAIESLRDQRVKDILDLKEHINRLHKVIGVRYDELKAREMDSLNTSVK